MNNLKNYLEKTINPKIIKKRIPLELENYKKLKTMLFEEFGFTIEKTSSNTHFKLNIFGPENSIYEGGYFQAEISLKKEYPFKPLSVEFFTKILHHNVSNNGITYLDLNYWKPSYGLI